VQNPHQTPILAEKRKTAVPFFDRAEREAYGRFRLAFGSTRRHFRPAARNQNPQALPFQCVLPKNYDSRRFGRHAGAHHAGVPNYSDAAFSGAARRQTTLKSAIQAATVVASGFIISFISGLAGDAMRTQVHDAIAVVGFIVLATTRLDTLRVIAHAAGELEDSRPV
jgi:hypothetical protein